MKTLLKSLAVFVTAAMIITMLPFAVYAAETKSSDVGASSGTSGDCTWTLGDSGELVISGSGRMYNYSLRSPAPWGTDVTSVVIESGVTQIGSYAFYDCVDLTSIVVSDTVMNITTNAFYGCVSLASISVDPDNPTFDSRDNCNAIINSGNNTLIRGCETTVIPQSVTSIGSGAFRDSVGLTNITIPEGVTEIGWDVFWGCSEIEEIAIPAAVASIGGGSFRGCSSMTGITVDPDNTVYDSRNDCNAIIQTSTNTLIVGCENTVMPPDVESIYEYAFAGSPGLTEIEFGDSLTEIGFHAFENCTGLSEVTIPNSVTTIGTGAFSGCTGITELTLGNGIGSIGYYAFEGCTGLAGVVIPSSFTRLNNYEFAGCTGLKDIVIPASVTTFFYTAFYNCSGIESITVDEDNPVYDSRGGCNAVIETATSILIMGCKNTVIPDTVIKITDYAFDGCTGLTDIRIPRSVRIIDNFAFYRCTSLTSITVPESVTSIGRYAFGYDFGTDDYVKIPDFSIRGVRGSDAQRYANAAANGFMFIEIKFGDANLDGTIDVGDVTAIQRQLAEYENVDDAFNADVDRDDKITISDVTIIQRYLAEFITEL